MCTQHDCPHEPQVRRTPGVSRRAFLQLAAAGAGLAAVGARSAFAQSPADDTPEAALARLYHGNQRFVGGQAMSPRRNLERLQQVAPKQAPFAAFLGCADSRVPIELIFDQGFGDLFVTRVAGNVADPAIIGSLEFGTLALGAKVLYVLGHSACGAVAATIKGDAVPGQISTLYRHIRPAVRASGGDLNKAIAHNLRIQAALLAESSPVIAGLVKERRLIVAGGVYDLASGQVTPVDL
jgi:carbonic anhydrase